MSLIERRAFRLLDPLRVRWAEVDLQKIVFNGHYLMYFDTAVAAYWRAMALPYHATMEPWQGDLYVRKATVEYLASAQYDDSLVVGVRNQRLGNSSMTLQCAVFKRDQLLVHGELVYVFADPRTQTSKPIPGALREALVQFEQGEPMLQAWHGTWLDPQTQGAVQELIEEAPKLDQAEWGAHTQVAHGAAVDHGTIVRNRVGKAIAAARWCLPEGRDTAQCVALILHPDLRGSGHLAPILDAIAAHAKSTGACSLTAQVPQALVPSFLRTGFADTSASQGPTRQLTRRCG